jgi:hypothetical protein
MNLLSSDALREILDEEIARKLMRKTIETK